MPTQLDMYKARQNEIVWEYEGKIIAVKDGAVLGSYPTKTDALEDMQRKRLGPGEFMIIKCTPGDEEYTARSRSPRIARNAPLP